MIYIALYCTDQTFILLYVACVNPLYHSYLDMPEDFDHTESQVAVSLTRGGTEHVADDCPPPTTHTPRHHPSAPCLAETTPLPPNSPIDKPYHLNRTTPIATPLPLSATPHSPSFTTNPPQRQFTNATTINENEKQIDASPCNPYVTWPPWRREDGWAGWRDEWVRKDALVIPLIVQAFSAGVLDATTYADFMTFASNRESPQIIWSSSFLLVL